IVFTARFLDRPPRRPYSALFAVLAGLAVVAPVGGRVLVALTLTGVAYVWHYRVRRLTGIGPAALRLVLLAATAMVGALRARSGDMGLIDSLAYTSKSFDGFESLVALSSRLHFDDVVWGRTYFEGSYSFIPRFLWTTKPQVFGALAVEG